jgi:WD40 repeat protein
MSLYVTLTQSIRVTKSGGQRGGALRSVRVGSGLLVVFALSCFPLQAQEPVALEGHEFPVCSAVFSPDGKMLATGDTHGTIKLWDLAKRKERLSLDAHESYVWSLAFSPDGKILASGGGCLSPKEKGVKLWDVSSGKELPGPEGRITTSASTIFTPDGKALVFTNGYGYIKVWEIEAKKMRASIEAPGFGRLVLSPDGKVLAAGAGGGKVKVWDTVTNKELYSFKASSVDAYRVLYTTDGKAIVILNFNGASIQVWEPEKGSDKIVIKPEVDEERINVLALAPKGKVLATGTIKGLLQLWDCETWKVRVVVPADAGCLHAVVFSPDGKWLVTGGNDKKVKLWEVAKLLEQKPGE